MTGWKLREFLGIGLVFLLGSLVYTFPLALGLGELVVDEADPLLNAWALSWGSHALLSQPLALFDANIFYPESGSLAFSEQLLGITLTVWPIALATGRPILTHNVALLVQLVLSGLGMYLLTHSMTRSRSAALVAGSLFVFLPYRLAHLSHLQLQATASLPFVFWSLSQLVERPSLRWGALFGLAVWWTSASCGYYGVFTWLVLGVAVPYELVRRGRDGLVRRGGWIVAVLTLSGLAYLPLARPYMRLGDEFGFSRPVERLIPPSAKLHSYARSPIAWHQGLGLRDANAEQSLFPGFSLLVLSCVGLASLNRRSGLYACIAAFAFWASLGPPAGLYGLFHAWVPGVSGLRVPARFSIYVFFGLSVLAGFGTSKILETLTARSKIRGRLTRYALAGIFAAAPIVESTGTKIAYRAAPERPGAWNWLDEIDPSSTRACLPMPWSRESIHHNARYSVWSVGAFAPLVNGYSGFMPPAFYDIAQTLEDIDRGGAEAAFEALARYDVTYLLVHRSLFLKPRAEAIEALMDQASAWTRIHTDDEVLIYRRREVD